MMDTIFPVRCVNCGMYDTYFCPACLEDVRVRSDFERLGTIIVFAAAHYNNKLIEKAIKTLKYGFIRDMAAPLAKIVGAYVENVSIQDIFNGNPLLVPVPLHKKRMNWRGFNQSELLAEEISKIYKVDVGPGVLRRKEERRPQADLEDRSKRTENIKGVFRCSADLNGRDIILVDDICTTGATLNECAKALAQKGAGKVRALVIARG